MRPDASDWLHLALVPGVSGSAQRALLRSFGSPEAVIAANRQSLDAIVGGSIASLVLAGPAPEAMDRAMAWLSSKEHTFVALGDASYPQALLETPDPPTILYAIGDVSLLNQPALAIVGSRNATRQGVLDAEQFARLLSDAGYVITSGLAHGIDSAAHRGGLHGLCSTTAVVGTGPDRVYPAANRNLAHEIAGRGLLVSEYPVGSPPLAANFPRRNRIIAGLSRGVLVVEAATKSGSLTTARLALEQGKDVFAVPGSIHSPNSKGCHWLIKQGAKLVECVDDILSELGGPRTNARLNTHGNNVDPDESPLLTILGHSPTSVDALAARSGLSAPAIAATLTALELSGRVERLPGGLFRRLAVP